MQKKTKMRFSLVKDSGEGPRPHKYQAVLEQLLKNLNSGGDANAHVVCRLPSEPERNHDQRGFHSSGTGRKLKRQGYRIITKKDKVNPLTFKVWLIPPRKGQPSVA